MGCASSSVVDVDSTIAVPVVIVSYTFPENAVFKVSKISRLNLQGDVKRTDGQIALPKTLWIQRMNHFMERHLKQLLQYSSADINVLLNRLQNFQRGNGSYQFVGKEAIHTAAVAEIAKMFDITRNVDKIKDHLWELSLSYLEQDRVEEFEHLAFIFSIIVNAPMIQMYETM